MKLLQSTREIVGRTGRVLALGLGLLLPLALPAAAEQTADPASADQEAAWEETLQSARDDLVAAQARVAKAEAAYQDWRQRKYPRGARKAELLAEIEEAKSDLADAEAAYPEVLETLRRAGAPQGLLMRFEQPPAAPER